MERMTFIKMRFVIIAIVLSLVLAGCAKTEKVPGKPTGVSRFMVLETTSYWQVLVDRHTHVMYVASNGSAHVITVLVDADGKPLLYKEDDCR